jgi:hypothetical protein
MRGDLVRPGSPFHIPLENSTQNSEKVAATSPPYGSLKSLTFCLGDHTQKTVHENFRSAKYEVTTYGAIQAQNHQREN